MLQRLGKGIPMLPVFQAPIPPQADFFSVKVAAAAGLHFPDTPENAAARGPSGTQQHNLRHALGVYLSRYRRMRQQCFQLRGKEKPSFPERVKQRLYADPVPGQKQPLGLFLPDGKGKNTVKPLHTAFSPLCIGVENHFRVGVTLESMSIQFQKTAQLLRIIQFPIIHHVIVGTPEQELHRLASAF